MHSNKLLLYSLFIIFCLVGLTGLTANSACADEETLDLATLISEALSRNPELLAFSSRVAAAQYRVPQAKSLPDPMFMLGYQNEGWERYTYGDMPDAQWMFSISQMFPFPGKLALKERMTARDAEGLADVYKSLKLKTIEKVKGLYYDLLLGYKSIELIKERIRLFSGIEDAALARYSTGMAPQQEVLMAQTEKYMLIEKEEMFKQKIQATEAMLNAAVGRDASSPLGRPAERVFNKIENSLQEVTKKAFENSPELKSKEKMIASAEAGALMAKKEYYPDFTLTAGYFRRSDEFDDMWSLTTAMNIPLFYKTKQRQAVFEAEAMLSEARSMLEATKLMISSDIRDNYSMMKTSEKLMDLYKSALIPKTIQDFEGALAGYISGKIEAITVIYRLKALLDYELLYWEKFVGREKAIARIEAVAGKNE
ncbi:MAG: TolC family protein [Thermodesulfovibrionales bacterium]